MEDDEGNGSVKQMEDDNQTPPSQEKQRRDAKRHRTDILTTPSAKTSNKSNKRKISDTTMNKFDNDIHQVTPNSKHDDDESCSDIMTPPITTSKSKSKLTINKLITDNEVTTKQNRTESFDAIWSGNYHQHMKMMNNTSYDDDHDHDYIPIIPPHTLILGTHPSITSLSKEQFYGHPMNAFWWIVGDCLGFRRDMGITSTKNKKSNVEPTYYKFTSALRYDINHVISYSEQMKQLVCNGFALWDIIQSCERIGSLDSNIKNEIPNNIREFCQHHPTIRRIVFANGTTGSKYFIKYNKDWLKSNELISHPDHIPTIEMFQKYRQKTDDISSTGRQQNCIQLVMAISVSPAAAKYTYLEKRTFWEKYVFQSGLADLKSSAISSHFLKPSNTILTNKIGKQKET